MTIKTVVGEVKTFSKAIDYSDLLSGSVAGAQDAVTIHDIIPEGWEVVNVRVRTLTAFNGSGTRALAMGVTGAATAIFTGLDVKSAAIKEPSVTRYLADGPGKSLILTLTTATDQPTAGKLLVSYDLVPAQMED